MRAAPAVTVRCTGGWPWRLVQAVLPALAVASSAAWGLFHFEAPLAPAIAASFAAGAFAWWRAAPCACQLRWDAQVWSVDESRGRLQLMLDLGPALLLRFQPEKKRRARWVAVTATDAAGAWHALRAAVYSRPPEATPRVPRPDRAAD